jgi:hypothetical protein
MNQKRQAAAGKILRRCTICGKFHASYLVDDPELGKCYLCYSCWTARQPQDPKSTSKVDAEDATHLKKSNG